MNEDEKPKPSQARVSMAGVAAPRNPRPDSPGLDAAAASVVAAKAPASGIGVADVQTYIGRQLRAVFDDVAKQPVPQRFLDLMAQLEERTGER